MSDKFRQQRIKKYCELVTKSKHCIGYKADSNHCSWYAIQKQLEILDSGAVPAMAKRTENFKELVKSNFTNLDYFMSDNPQLSEGHNFVWGAGKETTSAFKMLKKYAHTSYGAMMVKRILLDNKKPQHGKRFFIRLDSDSTAQAGTDWISLPADFPLKETFPGGEKIDPLAVIHHEFGHTKFYEKVNHKKAHAAVTICHERLVVINNSNPVRIFNGLEPRYTYFKRDANQTINIITGDIKPGIWLYNKEDPSVLEKPGAKK